MDTSHNGWPVGTPEELAPGTSPLTVKAQVARMRLDKDGRRLPHPAR